MTAPWPPELLAALQRGQLLVVEVDAPSERHRSWIAVYPLRPPGSGFNLFHRRFELSYIDNDRCIGPDDGMTELRKAHASDETELTRILAEWSIDPRDLTYAHRSEYPV